MSAADSLAAVVGHVAGRRESGGGVGGGGEGFRIGGDFSDWEECVSVLDGGWLGGREGGVAHTTMAVLGRRYYLLRVRDRQRGD